MKIATYLFCALSKLNSEQQQTRPYSISNVERSSYSTALQSSSSEEPKSPPSKFKDQQQRAFRSFLPISILLSTFSSSKSSQANEKSLPTSSITSPANFSYSELREVIQQGKVFVIKDFIDADILAGLREDITKLVDTNQFARSGLSNRAKGR
jgi:hypothetical protein